MLKPKMEELMNAQVNAELHSSNLYLAMSAYLVSENFPGMGAWMRVQAGEEHEHAMKFFDQILQRGGKVNLGAIAAPATAWGSPEAVFEAAAAHEAKVTGMINALVEQAQADKDHASSVFLNWFVTEQVEEEATAKAIVAQLKLTAGSKGSLLMVDHQLGKRAAA